MLRFVVALGAEARPLVARLRLERIPGHRDFPVFSRGRTALVISGVGKAAAAAAVSYLHRSMGDESPAAWINVGIAGHRRRPVGEAVVAHRIRDLADRRWWDLPTLSPPICPSDEVLTVDRPETAFRQPGAYDMEASGFYPTARRRAAGGPVHCLKVVSDGPGADLGTLTARRVGGLIEGRLATVEELAARCVEGWR